MYYYYYYYYFSFFCLIIIYKVSHLYQNKFGTLLYNVTINCTSTYKFPAIINAGQHYSLFSPEKDTEIDG